MNRTCIAVISLLVAHAAAAQPAPIRLSLADAISRGLENSHRIAEAKAREEGAKAAAATASLADRPVFAATGGYTRTNHVVEFFVPQPDGTQRAIHVHVFPEALRGVAEGHFPWDNQPKSMMTNATVAETVKGVDGQTITVKYKDGEKKIVVPPGAPIVTYVPGSMADLKPGAKIFIVAAARQPDGTFTAARVNVGKDGLTPPM